VNQVSLTFGWLLASQLLLTNSPLSAQMVNWEEEPIRYSDSLPSRNPVAELQLKLETGFLDSQQPPPPLELLARLLDELKVSSSSQVLVFSKTSLQDPLIGPKTPRAIYFNDQVHLGYVQNGLIEVAVADPDVGAAFYTLDPQVPQPRFERQVNHCLSCHAGAKTNGVPGLLVRSVYPNPDGQPVIRAGSSLTKHSTPLEKRWGGWYVTGSHGNQSHLGNYVLTGDRKPKQLDNAQGLNRLTLSDEFDTHQYLSPHSDLVALMVLEHQAEALNLLTNAIFVARTVEHSLNASASESTQLDAVARIDSAVSPLVDHLLFADEFRLHSPVNGTSDFVHVFAQSGPFDLQGQSARRFELQERMFVLPWSYLIYSKQFTQLRPCLQQSIAEQLTERLSQTAGQTATQKFIALAPDWFRQFDAGS
jgi:hypothetical protein